MISVLSLTVTLLLVRSVWSTCSCSPSPFSGLTVNCSSQDLGRLPDFPLDTTELYLQHNRLLTIPPGFFDSFLKLRMVDLSGNPFHCGCNIQYLRAWLLKNPAVSVEGPTCSTPPSRAHRTVSALGEVEFSSCRRKRCSAAGSNLALCLVLCGVLGLLLWSLLLVKDLSFTLGIGEKHDGMRAETLRSLKPKHRTRVKNLTQGNEELETPLLDMEILPQIIDTLHKRHNIKIKHA
ncbi:Platelet glycoprotein IX [Bagarius yarrelli]|uniref:Platelet glycoprotein IX n=1 Tax=Bagarius yarrelli TaxID=175774 RepID=A0A556VX36_BAGYA|nr:Platelet glycoprotein IX [Bagarius yarrelli]